MNKHDFLNAKQYQLELVLLGFLLAQPGDRERIMEKLSADSLFGKSTGEVYRALLEGDRDGVRQEFEAIHKLEDGKPIADTLVEAIEQKAHEAYVREQVAAIMVDIDMSELSTLESRLSTCLQHVKGKSR